MTWERFVTPLHFRVGYTTSEAVMALRLNQVRGLFSSFLPTLVVIHSSASFVVYPKKHVDIYVHAFRKAGKGISYIYV